METRDPSAIAQRVAELRCEHRALDERIGQLAANPDDDLEAKRLKKRKLQLKDCIARLESLLIPDQPPGGFRRQGVHSARRTEGP